MRTRLVPRWMSKLLLLCVLAAGASAASCGGESGENGPGEGDGGTAGDGAGSAGTSGGGGRDDGGTAGTSGGTAGTSGGTGGDGGGTAGTSGETAGTSGGTGGDGGGTADPCVESGLDCGPHGACDGTSGVATCACDPGWEGAACDAFSAAGNGADGDRVLTADTNLSTTNTGDRTCSQGGDAVAYSVTALSADAAILDVAVEPGCLAPGDSVLLINLRGHGIAVGNVGNHELLTVAAVDEDLVTFTAPKARFYGAGLDNDADITTSGPGQRVVLQRVPSYRDLTLASGVTLSADPWDGMRGGVLALRVSGTLALGDGAAVAMDGAGYRGAPQTEAANSTGLQGESLAGGHSVGRFADHGGGGGGGGDEMAGATNGLPAGGGGYGDAGEPGLSLPSYAGAGGAPYGDAALSRLHLGSGGGSGGNDNTLADNPRGGAGGNGGGALWIAARAVVGSGRLSVRGADGQGDTDPAACAGGGHTSTSICWDWSGPGGGGSGGSLWLLTAEPLPDATVLDAAGGAGGRSAAIEWASGGRGRGGAGGAGRIAARVADGCAGGALDCGAQGRCVDDGLGARCECLPGFAGRACDVPEDCLSILRAGRSEGSGTYWIDADGDGTAPPQEIYCDMDYAGGGWTLLATAPGAGTSDASYVLGTPTPTQPGYVAPLVAKALALRAAYVHVRTTFDPSDFATSLPRTLPIENLRDGRSLHIAPLSAAAVPAVWQGPRASSFVSGELVGDTFYPTTLNCADTPEGLCVIPDFAGWGDTPASISLYVRGADACEPPPIPENGSVEAQDLTPGSIATYACDAGYVLSDPQPRVCLLDGSWSGDAPDCDPAPCGPPPAPKEHGTVDVTSETYGGTATYTCDSGYVPSDDAPLVCQADGSWSGTPPDCLDIDECADETSPCFLASVPHCENTNGSYDCISEEHSESVAHEANGQVVELGCEVGVIEVLSGDYGVNCGVAPGFGTSDLAASCDGSRTCDYTISAAVIGDPALGCAKDYTARWRCVLQNAGSLVPCDAPPAVAHGSVAYTTTTFMSTAVYSCDEGYEPSGNATLTCREDGTWDGPAPTCELVSCGPPPAAPNASVAFTATTYQSTATYTCDSGYLLASGYDTLTCMSDAAWSPSSAPSCRDANECAGEGGGHDCPAGGTCENEAGGYSCDCSGSSNPNACGEACLPCSSNHMQSVSCSGGTCNGQCAAGYADCNDNKLTDGCEAQLASDNANCGTCGNRCGGGTTCQGGQCLCGGQVCSPNQICAGPADDRRCSRRVFLADEFAMNPVNVVHPPTTTTAGNADQRCDSGTGFPPGTFRAWFSTSTQSAAERFASHHGWNGYYVIRTNLFGAPNYEIVAAGWSEFASGQHRRPINYLFNGIPHNGTNQRVLTGTAPDGSLTAGNNCNDWSSNPSGYNMTVGNVSKTDAGWTQDQVVSCDNLGFIYCVQVD